MLQVFKDARGQMMHSWQLREKLGLPTKLPPHALPDFWCEGVVFRVEARPDKGHWLGSGRKVKSSTHRLKFYCQCGKWVPCGRAHQHICKTA